MREVLLQPFICGPMDRPLSSQLRARLHLRRNELHLQSSRPSCLA
jgi:hypothetical protein